jgi:exopolyphosphatase/guanosine-5'-triphosphate,3'-diphosphate pyrophosphatase
MRVGVLDLGSNSFHLLLAEVARDGSFLILADAREMVRLGAPTLRSGRIDDVAWDRALAVVGTLLSRARLFSGARLVGVATSVLREASNGQAFANAVRSTYGLDLQILTGSEEARLAYLGAKTALPAPFETLCVIDVGGGSVEVCVGRGERALLARSLPIGALRLREGLVPKDGVVQRRQVEAISAEVGRHLAEPAREVAALSPEAFVLTGGTSRALARIAAAMPRDRGTDELLGRETVIRLVSLLTGRPPATLDRLGVEPGRRDTVAVGAVVVATILTHLDATYAFVSRQGLREGVLVREARAARARSRGVSDRATS